MKFTRLRDLREQNEWPQRTVASMLHTSQRAYSYYENGNRAVPVEILSALADIYQVSTDYLLERTDNPVPYPKNRSSHDQVSSL